MVSCLSRVFEATRQLAGGFIYFGWTIVVSSFETALMPPPGKIRIPLMVSILVLIVCSLTCAGLMQNTQLQRRQ